MEEKDKSLPGHGYGWCQEAIDAEADARPWWMARGIVERGGVALVQNRQNADYKNPGFKAFQEYMNDGVVKAARGQFARLIELEGERTFKQVELKNDDGSERELELYDDEFVRVIAVARDGYLHIFGYAKPQPVKEATNG